MRRGFTGEINLFPGPPCLILLEMGMTASSKLPNPKSTRWRFIASDLLAPSAVATVGIVVEDYYIISVCQPLDIGMYVLISVLCGAASNSAVPAVLRLAILEASPTLPLAASLGLTFSWNVTVVIPVCILIAKVLTEAFPIS